MYDLINATIYSVMTIQVYKPPDALCP